ncbi:MAG: TonB-dependent receptor, partial [Gammaproteobacteria bacterium HGW-Gammaproteobacteria-8]
TASVVEVLGSEQMSRAGDGDAASALKRVTGLTLVGGEFIFIRGLGERYSATLLNGHTVPSPDPTRKVVPLSLFPTGVIESIRIQKGYSPEFPGDFGGGAVEIRTSGIPEKNFLKLGVSTSIREGTTFQDGLTYPGGDRDFSGFDDGTRSLPGIVRQTLDERGSLARFNPIFNPDGLTPEELEALGESFTNIYDPVETSIAPDRGVSIEGGMLFDRSDWRFGFRSSLRWGDNYSSRSEIRRSFALGSGELQVTRDFILDRTQREVELSGATSFGVAYRDLHRIDANSMILRLTEDDTKIQQGFDENAPGNQQARSVELEFEERQMIAHQVRGEHLFPELLDIGLNWKFSWAEAQREAPDNRIVRFENDDNSPTGFRFSQRADSNFRNFSDLTDETLEYGFDGFLPFQWRRIEGRLSGGWQKFERDRDSSILRFSFDGVGNLPLEIRRRENIEDIINPDTIGPNGFFLVDRTRPTDNSTALLDIDAWFVNLDFTLFDSVRLSGGVRFEDWVQQANTFQLSDPERNPVMAELANEDWFPSLSATWFINDRHQLRGSYAETLVRPDLRELSPAPFTDPVLDREVVGNPDLVQSELQHFDLRYDWLFSSTELLSLGLFYKIIDNPIERGQQPGTEQRISFNNVVEAELYGAELEMRKELGFLGRRFSWLGWGDRFTFSGNVAYIESEITIDPRDAGVLTSTSRRLQGQSPFVVNAQLSYDHPDEVIKASLLYNVAGERISEFGVLGQPDLIEQPEHLLDFNLSWRWSDLLTLKFKAGNLLDAEFEIVQGDKITQQFTRGRTWGLGLDLSF